MTTRERKLLTRTALLGLVVTGIVLVLDRAGALQPLDTWLSDRRVRYCQRYAAKPTDKLVHLDIDDPALDTIGRWPWPRARLARIVDEIRLAGAKTMAFDIILTDPENPSYVEQRDGKLTKIDHDKELADAVKQSGNTLMPIAFEPAKQRSPQYMKMYKVFREDLETDEARMIKHLTEIEYEIDKISDLDQSRFIRARARAMYERIFEHLMQTPTAKLPELRAKLLPRTPRNEASAKTRLLEKQLARVLAARSIERLARPEDAKQTTVRRLSQGMAPIDKLGAAASATGFVYYEPDDDGAVRQVVLWINHGGRLYPQLGMALACSYLGVDINDIEIGRDEVIIPRPSEAGGPLSIPVYGRISGDDGSWYGTITDLPWFGTRKWSTMYDPEHQDSVNHVPINQVWAPIEIQHRIRNNNRVADLALTAVLGTADTDALETYKKRKLPLDDVASRVELIKSVPDLANVKEFTSFIKEFSPADLDEDSRGYLKAYEDLPRIAEATVKLEADLVKARTALTGLLDGKAVIMGWTATGAIADFVPTPLHALCPGVVVHGVVFNAIMTGEVWSRAPGWLTSVILIALALATIAAVCLLSPEPATGVCAVLAIAYLLINGFIFFDKYDTIVGAAGPLTAIAFAWGGCTLFRFIVERAERARITARFSSYVDPALVNYVIEHPEKAKLDGERKELSVVFTDLQGFTTISELLGERTVSILNEYMGLMTESIRERDGYVNKFLGDGIMFFYGAPLDNPNHAIDAMATSVKMQELIVPFNAKLAEQDLPEVFVRIGVGTGNMIVGDCGSADASDYTVLGDIVNSTARLESANKQTGTWIMCNERCHELLEGRFLCRTIGELQVVGKSEGMKVYNPLDWTDKATDEQREIVRLFEDVVTAYTDGDFKRCIQAINVYEKTFEPYKLSKTYRELCEQYIAKPPEEFLGRIVLSSK